MDEYYFDDDDVGLPRTALRRERRGGRKAKRGARRAARGQDTPRRLVLGLGSVSVAAGSTATLTTTVQRPIQGDRLVLVSNATTPTEITVTDVKVGVRSQLNSTAGAPIQAFQPDSVRAEFHQDPAGTGVDYSVELANSGAGAIVVQGALYGGSYE